MVVLPVVVADFAQDPGGSTDGDDIGGDVLGDHGSCANDAVITDCHSRNHDDAGTEPAVLADVDGEVVLVAVFTQFWQDGVPSRGEGDVGPHHCVVADVNVGVIDNCQVKVA